jgi:hypothetical protein
VVILLHHCHDLVELINQEVAWWLAARIVGTSAMQKAQLLNAATIDDMIP